MSDDSGYEELTTALIAKAGKPPRTISSGDSTDAYFKKPFRFQTTVEAGYGIVYFDSSDKSKVKAWYKEHAQPGEDW